MQTNIKYNLGVPLALLLMLGWLLLLLFNFSVDVNFKNPLIYLLILLQAHLYTGLFITAHDGMHSTISRSNNKLNNVLATVAALLFAYNWFPRLKKKHFLHHTEVATARDPDYYHGSFWPWYFNFIKNYITWWQIILMALTYNLLKLWVPEANIFFYWMMPAILSTLQLFYFGTYLPHRGQHAQDNQHKASTQKKNHLLAFFSCYFFGYHYEHHDKPFVPWWQLYKTK